MSPFRVVLLHIPVLKPAHTSALSIQCHESIFTYPIVCNLIFVLPYG